MKRVYGKAALLMAAIVAVSAIITHFTAVTRQEDDRFQVVATFYPVYIAALNLTEGTDAALTCLVQSQTGCLHDYQLSPNDLFILNRADLLLMNGAGAEAFLGDALDGLPSLAVVDSADGVPLSEGHEEHDHGHDHAGEAVNEHIWTSPVRYIRQVENLRDGLAAADPANADRYRENAAAYIQRIEETRQRLLIAAEALPYRECVTFHDSLSYLAEELGLIPVAALSMGEESGLAAADLSGAYDAVRAAGHALLLYDAQYVESGTYYRNLEQAGDTATLTIDTAVSGPADKDAWLNAMNQTAALLEEVAQYTAPQ